jgi:IrrE N-terminal-like domain
MAIHVPFLSQQEIERSALTLLAAFGKVRDGKIAPPVPVEDILEKHLKLTLDFDDLHGKLGISMNDEEPEVLGALWVDSREVFIDQSLDPDEHPEREGRYRFTVAHEIGHYCLHKDYLTSGQGTDVFGHGRSPTVICRATRAKERIERQADNFASCLLMPEPWVRIVWREQFSRLNALVFSAWRDSNWAKPPMGWRAGANFPMHVPKKFDVEEVAYFFYRASIVMAPCFNVSSEVMRVRLEQLGLLLIDEPAAQAFALSA